MDDRDFERILTEVLRADPLAELPPGFNERLLAQLPPRQSVATSQPRFRLAFLDLSLPVMIALSMGSIIVLAFWLGGLIAGPVAVKTGLGLDLQTLWNFVQSNVLWVVLLGAGLSGLSALAGALIITFWDEPPVYLPA